MKHLALVIILISLSGLLMAQAKSTISDSYNAETAKNYTRSLQIMEEISAKDPDDAFYTLRIAWLQYLLGRYNDAIKNYTRSNNASSSLDAQTGILNCYLALGKWSDAKALADQILKSHPQNVVILGKAAYASYMMQNYRATADYYLGIIKITPWDMESLGYLVNNLYLAKDVDNAKKHFARLKKYYPDSPMVKEYNKLLGS